MYSTTRVVLKALFCNIFQTLGQAQRRHGKFDPGKAQYSIPNFLTSCSYKSVLKLKI